MNNAITEIISTLEGTNSRITEAEDRISGGYMGKPVPGRLTGSCAKLF